MVIGGKAVKDLDALKAGLAIILVNHAFDGVAAIRNNGERPIRHPTPSISGRST